MKDFYRGKKVLITGNTGFKGSLLSFILSGYGAEVTGYSMPAPTCPALYDILQIKSKVRQVEGDIRDYGHLQRVIEEEKPEIVFHLAAQPIVRASYENPVYTYETNVMGTVYLCEAIRKSGCVKSFLNVTTDKVYWNKEQGIPFTEEMPLDGLDPYSNSKSCSELVTHSYIHSFFDDMGIAVSTARAGNVIGGGDFAKNRIIPDCFRAAVKKQPIIIRNPHSIRPYQHVLEPLYAYLLIAMKQYGNKELQGYYNVGPNESDCLTTGEVADLFCKYWGEGLVWENQYDNGPYESGCLKLNCNKIRDTFNWQPRWSAAEAVQMSADWYKAYAGHENMIEFTIKQMGELFDV